MISDTHSAAGPEPSTASNAARLEKLYRGISKDVGKTVHESDWYTITQEKINQFCVATNDFQWIHSNPERASTSSPFGCTVAHGFLTLSLYPYLRGLTGENAEIYPDVHQMVNYGINKLRLMSPVRVNAKIKSHSVLTSVTPSEHGLQIIETATISIANEKKPALVGELLIVLM